MYFDMVYDIRIGNYKAGLIAGVEIHKSVDLLADVATIVMPGAAYNQALNVEDRIARGDRVTIMLGYDDLQDPLKSALEFEGYLLNVSTDDGSIALECEDDIFLTRKSVEDKQFNDTNIKTIAEYVCAQVGGLTVNCSYDILYNSFVITKATGWDVLKKIQDETRANIYVKSGVLHIHPPYTEVFGRVTYDFFRNIESCDLQYKRAEDRKYEVEVEGISADGTRITTVVGTPGGDKRSIKVYGIYDADMLAQLGQEELDRIVYDGYEGGVTGWLVPYVEPGYSALLKDADYEYKEGRYYVVSVTTNFNENGASRKVELGPKLSA
jgi:hypothetical protein